MQLDIQVDAISHRIDTVDPDLLGKWIVEIFTRTGPWTPATLVRVQAYPSYVPTPDGRGRADWIADTRYLEVMQVRTPQDIVDRLQAQIDKLKERSNAHR